LQNLDKIVKVTSEGESSMRKLVIISFVAILSSLPGYCQAQNLTNRQKEMNAGMIYFSYAKAIICWPVYFEDSELRTKTENVIISASRKLQITLDPDPTTVRSSSTARDVSIAYRRLGEINVDKNPSAYAKSCYSLGLASGTVIDLLSHIMTSSAKEDALQTSKEDLLMFLAHMCFHAKKIDIPEKNLKKIEEITKQISTLKKNSEIEKPAFDIIEWIAKIIDILGERTTPKRSELIYSSRPDRDFFNSEF
jgi:hypothetical protein